MLRAIFVPILARTFFLRFLLRIIPVFFSRVFSNLLTFCLRFLLRSARPWDLREAPHPGPDKRGTCLAQNDFERFQYVFNTIFTVATPGVSLGEYAFPRPPAVSLPLGPFSSSVCGPISSSDFKPIYERFISDSKSKNLKINGNVKI